MTQLVGSVARALSTEALLGRGLASPLHTTPDRLLAVAEGPEKVRQAIFTILETEPGERLMLPEFGCGLQRFLMAPNGHATRAEMERAILLALQRFEPRIEVESVTVAASDDPAVAIVDIRYRHLVNGRPDNLVFPFSFG
jgi:hypothetical protein